MGAPFFLMLKIYAIPVSLYCAKLRILLRHKELTWEEVPPPGGYGSEEYQQIIPAGNLPALEHDGLLLGDSEAISEYLNELYPDPQMLPGDIRDRAKIRERSRFHDTRIEPVVRSLFAHIKPENRNDEIVARQWEILSERLSQVRPLLPKVSETLTIGDCGYPITCTWISDLTRHFDLHAIIGPEMEAYLEQIHAHSAVAMELADYQPKLSSWLAAQ